MRLNSYCVLPVAVFEVPLVLPEFQDPRDGVTIPSAPLVADEAGEAVAPSVFYANARRNVAGSEFIIKGEWTLRQQLGLHLAGGQVLTHEETLALMGTPEWTEPPEEVA